MVIQRRAFLVALTPLLMLAFTGMASIQEPVGKGSSKAETKAPAKTDSKTASLHLKIAAPGKVSLDAQKQVPIGINGFDAMKDFVALKSTNHPMLGEFITSLCGVDAPNGKFWALYVDGKLSEVGISSVTIDKNLVIEWKLQGQ